MKTKVNPFKWQKIQVPPSQALTIDLIDCDDDEEEVISPYPVIVELTEHVQAVINLFNNDETKDSIPIEKVLEPSYTFDSSSSTFLLSSI